MYALNQYLPIFAIITAMGIVGVEMGSKNERD